MVKVTREEVLDYSDTEPVEEGYPRVTKGPYLTRATDATVAVGKGSGLPYVEYTPVLLESTNPDNSSLDGNDLPIKGFKLPKDRIILFAGPVDKDGNLKTQEKIRADTKWMLGRALKVVQNMTGGDGFELKGTQMEMAQSAANAIKGATFVAMVGEQREDTKKGYPARNTIREHRVEAEWEKLAG